MRPFVVLTTIMSMAAAKPQGGIIDGLTSAAGSVASNLDPANIAKGALSSVGLDFGANECPNVRLGSGVCAMLFEEDGCRGDSLELYAGSGNLPFGQRNKFESVVVAAGASFRGYDDSTGDISESIGDALKFWGSKSFRRIDNLGKQTILTSFDGQQKAAVIDDLEHGPESYHDLEEDIESYSCAFGSTCKQIPHIYNIYNKQFTL